jgi:hypothetical protein
VEKETGMNSITRTRTLTATTMFATVAAVLVGGANAMIPKEEGEVILTRPVAAVAATGSQYSVMSSHLAGLLRAAQTRDREAGALGGQPTTTKPDAGTTGYRGLP